MTTGNFFDNLFANLRKLQEAEEEQSKWQTGSRNNADSGSRPIRYSVDGSVVEPDGTDNGLLDPVQRMVHAVEAEGEKAMSELSRMMHGGLSPYGESAPADAPIQVRGNFFWKNQTDLERLDTYKTNKDRAKLLADMFQNLSKLAEFSHLIATDVNHRMWERNQQRPTEVQRYGEVIREFSSTAIALAIREMMTMYPDMSMALIARSTFKPKK
jgi:hypothetical protein